jgi:hypothetical protein
MSDNKQVPKNYVQMKANSSKIGQILQDNE